MWYFGAAVYDLLDATASLAKVALGTLGTVGCVAHAIFDPENTDPKAISEAAGKTKDNVVDCVKALYHTTVNVYLVGKSATDTAKCAGKSVYQNLPEFKDVKETLENTACNLAGSVFDVATWAWNALPSWNSGEINPCKAIVPYVGPEFYIAAAHDAHLLGATDEA